MSVVENLIVEKRQAGKSFAELSETELRLATDKIILYGSSITGCELPVTDMFAEILSKQIIKLIVQLGYHDLTEEEVLFAMDFNHNHKLKMPAGIELEQIVFTGKYFNTMFLSKMLSNYMAVRNMLDRRFQNKIDGYE